MAGFVLAVRLAQYGALAPLFGLALFGVYEPKASRLLGTGWGRLTLALAGLAASLVSILALAGQMSGGLKGALDPATIGSVITATHAGWAWILRVAAMLGAVTVSRAYRPRLFATFSGLGLISLAWSGHAASGDGTFGLIRLAGDLVHLLAAGAWIGAIAAFFGLVARGRDPRVTGPALHRFSALGSGLVALLVLTGLINLWPSVAWKPLPVLTTTAWGWLMLLKLCFFAGMLGLAALHRFVLAPWLHAQADNGAALDTRSLRLSLGLELSLGLAVLAVVSVLGMLPLPIES